MAKLKLYAVHDTKAGTYMMPFPMLTDQLALRSFQQGCLDPQTPMAQYPLDHSIFRIGTYDDETGILESETPIHLQTAIQAIKQVEDEKQAVNIAKGKEDDAVSNERE
jgi:hypothetical protein